MHFPKYIWCFALLWGCNGLNVVEHTHEHTHDQEDIGASALIAPEDKKFNFSFITKPPIIFNLSALLIKPSKKTTTAAPVTSATSPSPTPTTPTVAPTCTCGTTTVNTTRKRSIPDDNSDNFDVDALDDDINDDHSRLTKKSNDFRIVHGIASKANAFPWMVALIQGFSNGTANLNQFCGGSLVNPQTVVTAAHCFNNFTSTSQIISGVSVLLGTNSLLSNVTARTVVRLSGVTIHPQFNRTSFDNDIAVLNLVRPVTVSSSIRPICLSQTGAPFNKRNVTVAGWGTGQSVQSSTFKGQKWLRQAGLQTMPNTRCTKLGEVVTPNMICALGLTPVVNSSSTCFGDSGGPLMLFRPNTKTYSLIGIVSHGMTPCGVKAPPVFTRVGNYLPFIMSSVSNGTKFCSNSFT